MFEGQKYMTRGVQQEIELNIQIIMWGLIEDLRKKENFKVDYLQVFDLQIEKIEGIRFQKITHKQEVEPYSSTKMFRAIKPMNAKIFVISGMDENRQEYSTMMLSHEY
jgi:hypothetical protein